MRATVIAKSIKMLKNNKKRLKFWIKVSKFSTGMCILTIIVLQFLSNYISKFFLLPVLIIGTCSVLMFIASQLMKFLLKKIK